MHPLWGPIRKTDRAQEHLKVLTNEIEGFIKRGRYGATIGERNLKTGKYPLRAITTNEEIPPLRWSLLVGEFAHNLRSALDHIACQLALSTATPTADIADLLEKTSFPVYLYPAHRLTVASKERWSDTGKQWLTYMSGDHVAILERFQPYHSRKPERRGPVTVSVPAGRKSPLWLLHEINNADKHRLLHVTARVAKGMSVIVRSAPPGFGVKGKGVYPKLGSQLVNGAYIGSIDIVGDWEGVDVHLGLHPQVVFWSGCDAVKGLPVLATLESILHEVRYRILVPLAKEFPPLDPPYGPPE